MAAVSTIWPVPVLSKSEQPVFVGTELSEINVRDGRQKNLALSEIALAATPKQDGTENPPMFEDEDSGLTAVFQQCTRSSKAVNCSVLLTSTEQDLNVTVFNNHRHYSNHPLQRVRIFDRYGNEYVSQAVQVGSLSNERYVETQLIQGVGLRLVGTFEDVPPQVGKITALEIPVKLSHGHKYTNDNYGRVVSVRVRNLTISE